MSGAEYFGDQYAINAHMDSSIAVDVAKAQAEHAAIKQALEQAGVNVITVAAPPNCQDGVYTANWGLCRGNKAVLSSLPNSRQTETPYAERYLMEQGKLVSRVPEGLKFSGQGDALPCGNYLFIGSTYRTDEKIHKFIGQELGYEVIGLETIPAVGPDSKPKINPITGWPDSYFYDLDLALAVLRPDLIAWCPEAFTPDSRKKIERLSLEKIEVTLDEALRYGCNLVSTGETVIMGTLAPMLKATLQSYGLQVVAIEATELSKGGGFIRCTTLSLDNQ